MNHHQLFKKIMKSSKCFSLCLLSSLAALSLGLDTPALARFCTSAEWCINEASQNNKAIYKVQKRRGAIVEFILLLVNPSGTRIESSERAMVNCESWQWREDPKSEWIPIDVDSKGDAMARDVCSR